MLKTNRIQMGYTTTGVALFVSYFFCFKGKKSRKVGGNMKVNGTQVPLQEEKTLLQYLQENQYDISKIAVERNGRIGEYRCLPATRRSIGNCTVCGRRLNPEN